MLAERREMRLVERQGKMFDEVEEGAQPDPPPPIQLPMRRCSLLNKKSIYIETFNEVHTCNMNKENIRICNYS